MNIWTCYLAGKISGISLEESNTWRLVAKNVLENIYSDKKVIAINPNDYYNFNNKMHLTEKEIIRFDLNKVRNSDVILVNLDGDSIGTSMELMLAHELHKPIVGYLESKAELHPWLEYVCDRICENIFDAIDYIKNYYLVE
jgi:nucleoside 2-deoxyribosyltransferase